MVSEPNSAEFDRLIEMAKGDPGVKNLLLQLFNIDLQNKYELIIEETDRYMVDVLRGQAALLKWYIQKLGG